METVHDILHHFLKNQISRILSPHSMTQGRTVLLEGLGSNQFCVSTPRLGDTKIFLVDQVQDDKSRLSVPKLRLRSSILKVNLRNLKVLWRLEEGEAKGKHRKAKSSNDFQKSPQGGRVISKKGATCDFPCSLHHQPVCGADKVLVSLNKNSIYVDPMTFASYHDH